jgi:exodeoxyribonuclease VII large subunit
MNTALKKLVLLNPAAVIKQHRIKIADLTRQIEVRAGHFIQLQEAHFLKAAGQLSSLSPLNILGRGYSITFGLPTGRVIKDAEQLKVGDNIRTRLDKGEILSEITEVN